MPFEQAVAQATDGLVGQVQKGPAFLAKLAKRSVVLDPMLDAATGQQTAATSLLETRVSERLSGARPTCSRSCRSSRPTWARRSTC